MRRRLSDDALSTLAEIEAECRDGEPWADADFREAEEAAARADAEAAGDCTSCLYARFI
jgi:hypothetical protein